jgi:hypothetical protein
LERQKFLENLSAAKKTTENASEVIKQLKSLNEEIQVNKGETRSLRMKLNRTAVEFGLKPIPSRVTKE